MKYFIALLLAILSIPVFAQKEAAYKDFIQQDNKIQWAAEYDQLIEITPTIKHYGIKEVLFKQLQKNGCISNYRIDNDSVIKTKFCLADPSLLTTYFITNDNIYHSIYINQYSTNSESSFIINEKKCSCIGKYQKNKFDVYRIKQIIYYKNAKLYIKNILVTPLCLKDVIDTNNFQQLLWQAAYSSCYNDSHKILTTAIKNKCIDLGNAEAMYNFNYDVTSDSLPATVFTKKNAVFSHHLYEDILNNKLTAIGDSNKIIAAGKIINYGVDSIQVMIGDDTTSSAVKTIFPDVSIDSFYKFTINQHFYFDTVNDILYSEVNYIDVNKEVITSQGVDLGTAAWYRVYFIAPALYKPKLAKRFLN
jgi:hypothetical protein